MGFGHMGIIILLSVLYTWLFTCIYTFQSPLQWVVRKRIRFPGSLRTASRDFKPWIYNASDPDPGSLIDVKFLPQRRKICKVPYALPETAVSVAIAATVVGAAATLLGRRNKSSEATEVPLKTCEDCGGSGICSECNGEGFVLKKLSEESAERARLTAKNMATRYTAGLPKKWSYCTKCSSSRSCSSCGGSGKLLIS